MSKLATFAALLVALVALAEATTYTTITTTTIEEETNPRGSSQQRCQEQIQRQQFSSCQRYLQSQQGSPYESLRMAVNPQREQHLEQCCQQLRNVGEECQCQAIKKIVSQQQQQQEGRQGEQMQEVVRRAQELPRRCNMRPQQCEIRAIWF